MQTYTRALALITAAAVGALTVPPPARAAEPHRCMIGLSRAGGPAACAPVTAAADATIEVMYLAGDGRYLVSAPAPCTADAGDVDYEWAVPAWGPLLLDWYQTFAGCRATHYELPDFAGRTFEGTTEPRPFPVRSIRWT
ncbi:hypothetical protein [Jidongwangia harbinensis]|uniref:hypothetical protein n=1 Tax=Jidongwangia harbinensis TaxID=2878561 RepID=UPI001CD92602|nr:hypothetical protein [Jidongwangia harbinensis]MCA2211928.1 hypothetical protein [Jidongwangia harbinensis]